MRNLTRKGKRNQPIGWFQDQLEAYGDLPAETEMNEEKTYENLTPG
jgi:hypothetical protein